MRRPPGPGIPFCVGLAGAIALARGAGLPTLLLTILGFTAAACGVTLRVWARSFPFATAGGVGAGRIWLAGVAGLVAGVGLAAPWPGRPFVGIREEAVRSFRAVAIEDSRGVSGGGVVHRVDLLAAGAGADEQWVPASGTVRLLCRGGPPTYAGERVTVRGRIERLPVWDRDDYASSATATALESEGIASSLLRLRRTIRVGIDLRAREMGYPVSAFFVAMFLGERAGVSDELAGLFRDAGALHVLALSGTHLVLIYGLAALLIRPLPWARVRSALPLFAVFAYVAVVGALPSIARALALLVVAWAARALDRRASGLDLLGLAGSLVLLAEPRMLFDLSFQLSFCAVLGMVTVGSALAERSSRLVPRFLALPLSAAVGAQAAVAPILLGAYGVFQPIGLVSGLVVAPCATALLCAGLLDIALPLWLPPAVHGVLGSAMYAAYRVLEHVLGFFARFPPSRSWALIAALWLSVAALLVGRPVLRMVRASRA